MSVIGQVDGLEGAYVVGWAFGTAGSECAIEVRTEDGDIVGKGYASRNRPDLSSLNVGTTKIAFRVAVRDLGLHDNLRVYADGTEIGSAPLQVGPGRFSGQMTARFGIVEGWVTERTTLASVPLITIVDQNGFRLAEGIASPASSSSDPHFVPSEFHIKLPDFCFGRAELRLEALANGFPFASADCALTVRGSIEILAFDRCFGWLFSPEAPTRAFAIEVFHDGEMVAKGKCDRPRADVNKVFPESNSCGFDISISSRIPNPVPLTTVSIRFPGSSSELFEGPYLIGSASAVVSSARGLAQLAMESDSTLGQAELRVLQAAVAELLAKVRHGGPFIASRMSLGLRPERPSARLNIIIPIYRGVQTTADCIHSVLAHCSNFEDKVILVNDCSPEAEMAGVLRYFNTKSNVVLLENPNNLGFIGSVNRGLAFCDAGDVVLLNSDTEVYAGGLDELWEIGQSNRNIATVTAMSNNATIFSYPHFTLRTAELSDIAWTEIAAHALSANRGRAIDMPTGHGFCMLIKREALDQVGRLDEAFGLGYGEENDFCARAADLGYRNVVATGAFVRHRESVSFLGDKSALLRTNLAILESRYPEYTSAIMECELADPLRVARWPLDAERLRRASADGQMFVLIVTNGLGGGTNKALKDINDAVGYDGMEQIRIQCRSDGFVEATIAQPAIRALFSWDEADELFQFLNSAQINLVVVHQFLGFASNFAVGLTEWIDKRNSVFYAHDFYTICQRVTLIDATGGFCDVAQPEICERCIAAGGVHETARKPGLSPKAHRDLFARTLSKFRSVIAPSRSTANYLNQVFPSININVIPHPEPNVSFPSKARHPEGDEVVLLGAIGPHKGSGALLDVAKRARLSWPALRFRVIGFTDIDEQLLAVGNVIITGAYDASELQQHLRDARGCLALFLPIWPETYSYTLSEAVANGFIPLVPNIGAPADRVRESGFGVTFSFPINPVEVVDLLISLSKGGHTLRGILATPAEFIQSDDSVRRIRHIFFGTSTNQKGGSSGIGATSMRSTAGSSGSQV